MSKQLVAGRKFYYLTEIHDRDPVREVLDDGKVVRDEHYRKTEFVPEFVQEVDDLRLYRNVESGYRFVCDYQIGFEDNGARNADTLSLSA